MGIHTIRPLLVILCLGLGSPALPIAGPVASPPRLQVEATGEIALPGISGAAFIRGSRLLLVSDRQPQISLLEDPLPRLRAGSVTVTPAERLDDSLRGQVKLGDLEAVAWDGTRDAILAGSHAREARGDAPEEHYRLGRLRFDALGKLREARQSGGLLQAIVNDVPFLADAIRRTPARTGLNIEGLAWHPEEYLLVGLRAPTITESTPRPHGGQEDAVVLRVRNLEALFLEAPQPANLGDTVKLDLQGHGIRDMAYDPARRACWLLSGLSAEPTHPVRAPWSLWLWDEKQPPQRVSLPDTLKLESPEALARVECDGRTYLLLIEDGERASRYALLSVGG